MNSRFYVGQVDHRRIAQREHRFRYAALTFVFDLDELEALDASTRLFGYNRFSLLSLYDRDFLGQGPGTLREKLQSWLDREGCQQPVDRVELVTQPRFLNGVFNPVSFYYCYGTDGSLVYLLAEVHNTFKEKHLYIVDSLAQHGSNGAKQGRARKAFHVSPFFDRSGEYVFTAYPMRETLEIHVDLWRAGKQALQASISGQVQPMTTQTLAKQLVRYPLIFWMTLLQIHWQALQLFARKRLRVYPKPGVCSSNTFEIRSPSAVERLAQRWVLRLLGQIQTGSLELVLPDQTTYFFGQMGVTPSARLRVHDSRFFKRLVTASGIGLGEGYTAGDWSTDDLVALLSVFIRNEAVFKATSLHKTALATWVSALWHRLRPNSRSGSARNIRAHYDLSNRFFQTFLDPSMTYSCARFDRQHTSLQQAQLNKLQTIIRKAQIRADDHVLEIGSGWGSLAIEAARTTGCRVTTVTVSRAQYELACERVRAAGLEAQIDVRLCDYRDIGGQFDAVISIEMIEAVGHRYLGEYFKKIDSVLKPDGMAVLQAITIPDQRYDAYRRQCDWIQKYIFPGGHLPALHAINNALKAHTQLIVHDMEEIGLDYARTLQIWTDNLRAKQSELESMGISEQQYRTWLYYFGYCQAGFSNRVIQTSQFVLTRAMNDRIAQRNQSEQSHERDDNTFNASN